MDGKKDGAQTVLNLKGVKEYISTNPKDVVSTPHNIAAAIVKYFKPSGKCLDPCRGDGAFFKCLPKGSRWCEISEGKDFYSFFKRVNWIISNPPYSDFDRWLDHSFEIADNIVYLIPLDKILKSWKMIIKIFDFGGIKEILLLGPGNRMGFQFGFPCGAIYLKKNYKGQTKIKFLNLTERQK